MANVSSVTNRRWPIVLVLSGMLFAGARGSRAATLEVDRANPLCSDSGPGSSATPLCTISQGALRAIAGDTVSVHTGTYTENVRPASSGTSSAPIVIRAASGAAVTVTSASRGFEVINKSWIQIVGFTVSGTAGYGISIVGSSNITVSSNEVTGSGRPIDLQTQPAIYLNNSTDCTISGNDLHHNSEAGIYLTNGSTRNLLASNVSSFNARGYTRAAAGIDVRSPGNTIRGNICHDNEDSGLQVYGVAGVPSPDNVIVNNVCYHNGDHGIDISSAGSQRIIGNSVFSSATSGINVEGPSGGTLVANNVSVDNSIGTGKGNIRIDAQSISGTIVDYDVVFHSQPGQTQIIWGSTSYPSLAAFVSAIGQETHGKEANPMWADASQADFHLTSGSPAIDCADSGAAGALVSDFEGLTRVDIAATPNTGVGPRDYDDRGAYEFQPSGTCGNGAKEPGEACDGADLGGATCASSGFFCGGGSGLACNANCTLNTSSCVASCPATDGCHTAGTCNAATDRCTNPVAPNGTACNDANACTRTDTCQSGVCAGANPVVCTASDACHPATCNTATGTCTSAVAPNGTPCNDGNRCTQTDSCQSGTCAGSNPVVCAASDACHDVGLCDPSTGSCSNPIKPEGTWCGHGNRCTHNDTCRSGVCTVNPDVVCTAIDSCHLVGTCSSSTGLCSNPPKANGTACDDGSTCTTNDACSGGVCTGTGSPLPGEVDTGVRLSKAGGSTTLAWNRAPNSTWSDITRGLLGALSLASGAEGSCLDHGVLGTTTTDAEQPAPGQAFWYLIRGTSSCGAGPYGFAVSGGTPIPRVVSGCP